MIKSDLFSSIGFSFLSLLLFLPIFSSISFEINNLVSFDRSIWISGQFQKETGLDLRHYLISLPLSIIFVILFAIKYFSKIIVNKSYQLTIGWILFVLIINFSFGDVSAMFLKVLGAMILFLTSILVFDEHFSRVNSSIKNAEERNNLESYYISKPFFLTVFTLLVSYIIYRDDTFIVPWLKIYNFDQYLTYSLFIFIGCFFRQKWQVIFLFAIVTYFSYVTRSDGLKIMLIILFISYLLYVKNFIWLKKYSSYFIKFAIVCIILYQFLSYFFINVRDFFPQNLSSRMEIIFLYFKNVNFNTLFFPLHNDISIIDYLHNEVLTILATCGFVGCYLFYKTLYNRINIIFNKNFGFAISLSIVIIIGSVLVLPTLHTFTGIIIAYLIAFYSTFGNDKYS